MSILIRQGTVILPDGETLIGDVYVRDGKIAAIASHLNPPEVSADEHPLEIIEASGLTLLAGVIDPLDRKTAKNWWREKKKYLEEWGLYEIWAKANPSLIADYEARFEAAVKAATKERRAQEELAKRGP